MKRILLTGIGVAAVALVFSSYSNGPAAGGAGNHTGSAGSTASCGGGGCHPANNAATICSLAVTPVGGGPNITSYVPGTKYNVQIGGGVFGTTFPKFGFQVSCVKSSNNAQAGNFTGSTGNHVQTVGGLQLVEQSSPITGTAGSGITGFITSFDWTAPAAGTGPVKFYGMVNAVNGNGIATDDQPNSIGTPVTITEGTTGISSVRPEALSIYPNPADVSLHIKLPTDDASVHVWNMGGQMVIAEKVSVARGEAVISTANLKAGTYFILASQGDKQFGASFTKQ